MERNNQGDIMHDPMPKPEVVLLPLAEPSEEQNFRLWRDAPGWRNLVISAIGLSAALLAFPLVAASSDDRTNKEAASCHGNPAAFSGPSGQGQVVGFLSSDQAMKLLQNTQFSSRMAINPDYLANVRSLVHLDGSPEGWRGAYLVPQGTNIQLGDHVAVTGGHSDPGLPCHYIPNLIVHVQH